MDMRAAAARLGLGRGPRAAPFGTSDPVARFARMRELGLEASEPVAHIRREGPGWSACGMAPRDPMEWVAALGRCLPRLAILRPDSGPFGYRLTTLAWDGDELVDHAGRRTAPWDLIAILTDPAVRHGWLLERRDRDDLAMLRLAGRPVPTIVAVTWFDGGDVRVVWIGVRGAPVGDDPRALAAVVHPPDAAAALPRWDAVSGLLARAARAEPLPAPAVGWDVLVTTEGPRIAGCWDPSDRGQRRTGAPRLRTAVVRARRTGAAVGWPLA